MSNERNGNACLFGGKLSFARRFAETETETERVTSFPPTPKLEGWPGIQHGD